MLSEAKEPLHYSEIAQRILDSGLHQQTGATPAATVAAAISTTLRKNVVRVDRGVYSLRTPQSVPAEESETELPDSRGVIPLTALEAGEENNGFLNAFGMFWRRDEVDWDKRGQTLLGAQLKAAKPVNFADQVGVYILYSGERVICVGRITEPRLGPACGITRAIALQVAGTGSPGLVCEPRTMTGRSVPCRAEILPSICSFPPWKPFLLRA